METSATCPECGGALPMNAPQGLCPRCLAGMGLGLSARNALPSPSQLTSSPSASPIGKLRYFGDYELLDEIARGGMGIVYRARQVSLNRIVAVKMLLFGQFSSEEFVKRFRAEAQAAASLQHPNIVAIHEIGEHEGQHYFSMDYVAGRSLAELVRESPLPPNRAAACIKVIAEAVHYAHEQGILHRDLKPSNVLIDEFDHPRITDFGLAKQLKGDSDLTVTGQVLGSPSYMPPEQADPGRGAVGTHSDVYALGAILYHLITCRPPFLTKSLEGTLIQLRNNEPVAPRVLNPGVPRDLETICLKCLEKDTRLRYGTASQLAAELSRFLRGEPITARPVSLPEKLWRWSRRKPELAALAATVAVLLLLVAGQLWRWRQAREAERYRQSAMQQRPIRNLPGRDLNMAPELIDLSGYYNDGLEDNWNARFQKGNNLAALQPGQHTFGGTEFDVRGLIQLSGLLIRQQGMLYFPETVKGIKVGLKCGQIHFLHTTGWRSPDGTQIGGYVIHYADGEQTEVPIRYGEDLRDGWVLGDRRFELARGTVAWIGTNAAGRAVRIFKSTWKNPLPKTEVTSLDFFSSMTTASPILIAVTVEP